MYRPSLSVTLLVPLGLGVLLGGCVATSQDVRPQAPAPAPAVQPVQRQTFVRTVHGVEVSIEASELGLAPAAKPAAAAASTDSSDESDDGDDDE